MSHPEPDSSGVITKSWSDHSHQHLFVPDARLAEGFGAPFFEVYSTLQKAFPIWGRPVGCQWSAGAGGAAEGLDFEFSDQLAEYLNRDAAMNLVLVQSKIPELVVFCGEEGWIICDPFPSGSIARFQSAYEALARSLLKAPVPDLE